MIKFVAFVLFLSLFAQTSLGAIDASNTMLASYDATGYPNVPLQFVIQAYDDMGQPLNNGGSAFEATIDNGGTANAILDNGDGTYSGSWIAPAPGEYQLSIFLINPPPSAHIKDSPFTIIIYGPSASFSPSFVPTPSNSFTNTRQGCSNGYTSLLGSYADGEGVEGVNTCVNFVVNFTIHARDLLGCTICHGGDDFSVKIIKPNLQTSSHNFMDNNDGTYFVEYTPNMDGLWIVSIRLGSLIKLPPYIVYHDVC